MVFILSTNSCSLIEEKDKKKCHNVHEQTNMEVFSGTIFIKQERLEIVLLILIQKIEMHLAHFAEMRIFYF